MANEKLVDIGYVNYDNNDNLNKVLTLSVNGKTIMLERGKSHKVPPEFAEAYAHRMKMIGRRMSERNRRDKEVRDKQNQDGVKIF